MKSTFTISPLETKEQSLSATQSSSQPLPLPLQQPMPPRAVRSLTTDNQQADSLQQRSPLSERAASPVVKEAQASPIIYCSQSRMEEYERQNWPLHRHEKVGGWLCEVQAAYSG